MKTYHLKRWNFYYGDGQRGYISKFEGESNEEYSNRVANATVENHCAKTCDVLVSYLYGQPNSKNRIIVRVLDKEGKINEKAQDFLQENIWHNNDIDSFRVDVGLMTSVTGCGVVHKEFVDKRTMLPFAADAKREDKIKYGTIRYDLFDTVDTMPMPLITSSGVVYPRMLGAIIRLYNIDNFSGISILDRLLQKTYAEDEILEVFDGQKFWRGKLVPGPDRVEVLANTPNQYGNINIPFTVFRNYGDPMYLEGISDLDQMIPLQNVLNEGLNADKAAIEYHSYPLLVLTGGAKLPSNFIRKVNSGLEMDINQDVKYLTWDNVLEASQVFKESVRKQMTVVSGVSQVSRGNAESIGQVRSGAGLKILFQADINAVALKIPYFREAEKRLVYSTLAMWEQETGESFGEDYFCEVEFPADFVGLDELLKAQTEQIEIANATRSIREAILDKHPELTSEEDVDSIISEIIAEKKKLALATKPPVAPEAPGKTVKPQGTTQKSQEQQTPK